MGQERATNTSFTLGTTALSQANTQDCKVATKIKKVVTKLTVSHTNLDSNYLAQEWGATREPEAELEQNLSSCSLTGIRRSSQIHLYNPAAILGPEGLSPQQGVSRAMQVLLTGLQRGPPVQRVPTAQAGATYIQSPAGLFAMALKAATRNSNSSPCQQMH